MEFYEVIETRRSIRSYSAEPVPEKLLNSILEATRIAPSGSNRQNWKFIVVDNPEIKKQLVNACGNQGFIGEAPIIIVACGSKTGTNRGGYMGNMSMLVDVSIAFTHLILSARAEGLGTCWIGLFDNNKIKKILGVLEDMEVVALTPLGYPKDIEFRSTDNRKPVSEIISINRF